MELQDHKTRHFRGTFFYRGTYTPIHISFDNGLTKPDSTVLRLSSPCTGFRKIFCWVCISRYLVLKEGGRNSNTRIHRPIKLQIRCTALQSWVRGYCTAHYIRINLYHLLLRNHRACYFSGLHMMCEAPYWEVEAEFLFVHKVRGKKRQFLTRSYSSLALLSISRMSMGLSLQPLVLLGLFLSWETCCDLWASCSTTL